MKKLFSLLILGLASLTALADNAAYTIKFERDTTISVNLQGINLGSRDIHLIHYEYPSKDIEGKAVTISGSVWVPKNIYDGTDPCDGVILYNHFTQTKAIVQPSIYGEEVCNGLLASPLKPNYILVISDFIGFGSTVDRPQAYLCGDVNARNSLDGLVAARQLMQEHEIPQGKYLFNMGYSQGGTEAMFVAKLRDMEYQQITFDKTFAGGGPLDFEKAYTEMVKAKRSSYVTGIVLMLVSLNENYKLGLDYKEVFLEPLASNIDEWICSKKYGPFEVNDKIGNDSLKFIIQPDYLDINSEPAKALREKLRDITLTNGWDIDPTQHYFIQHSRHDTYVGVQSVRSIVGFMTSGDKFKASLVPGKTGLQTNLITFKVDHQISGAIWAVQTAAALQLWPVIYYDGEQNPYYHNIVKDLTLLKAVKTLEGMGIDLRKLINGSGDSGGDIFSIYAKIEDMLKKVDLTFSDFIEMITDSGITANDLIEVITYLTTNPEAAARALDVSTYDETAPAFYLLRQYEQTLATWLLGAGLDVQYDKWGWSQHQE